MVTNKAQLLVDTSKIEHVRFDRPDVSAFRVVELGELFGQGLPTDEAEVGNQVVNHVLSRIRWRGTK